MNILFKDTIINLREVVNVSKVRLWVQIMTLWAQIMYDSVVMLAR